MWKFFNAIKSWPRKRRQEIAQARRVASDLYQISQVCINGQKLRAEVFWETLCRRRLREPLVLEAVLAGRPAPRLFCSSAVPGVGNLVGAAEVLDFQADLYDILNCDILSCWKYEHFFRMVDIIEHTDKPFFFFEDSFFKSILTVTRPGPQKYKTTVGFFVDDLGYHFDATRPSRLELLLNDPALNPTAEERERARRLMDRIVGEKLTKYNHQPIYRPALGRPGAPKVLVADQSFHDWSVVKSGATRATFLAMLAAAREQRPEADLIVKIHPDAVAQRRRTVERVSYFGDLKMDERTFLVADDLNPYALLEVVDAVYVCSSMLGLEALMAGKEVHVFGRPCYAGWGLTRDYASFERRTRRRTLEELVYILYVLYTRYTRPGGGAMTAEEAVDHLLELRREYFRRYGVRHDRGWG